MTKECRERIVGTLKHGAIACEEPNLLWLGWFLAALSSALIIGLAVFLTVQSFIGERVTSVCVGAFMSDIFAFPIIGGIFYATSKCIKNKKEILSWTEDAVELKAYSREVGALPDIYNPEYRIEVDFYYQGQRHYKMSYCKSQKGNMFEGYCGLWENYRNRVISILYSPKYDEVLILKERQVYREAE